MLLALRITHIEHVARVLHEKLALDTRTGQDFYSSSRSWMMNVVELDGLRVIC